jgi:lysyl-tRNA synthetase, class I
MPSAPNDDWVARTAADVIATAAGRHAPPTCASGISPSGNVHLGNLRELMTPHLVADEVRRSGTECRHILSWDDYDRFRRVPPDLGLPDSFTQYIGRPLTSVPDPDPGKRCHENWAEHFKDPLRDALGRLGVTVTEISQTQMYASGAYSEQVLLAMHRRADIGAILRRYQTRRKGVTEQEDEDAPEQSEYFPFRPYCATCGTDDARVTAFNDETDEVTYTCGCGAAHGPLPIGEVAGKLAWKVDWPMRWAYEQVTFEPAGVDHSSPGSSFTVGEHLVIEIFGGHMPLHFQYSNVGAAGGSSKLSSSKGGAPTPSDALEIFEAPLLRWLYARRRPEQSITLAFGTEIGRIYDEWDALTRKVAEGTAESASQAVYKRSASTADGPLPQTPRTLPFSTLASVFDVTVGDEEQELRVIRDLTPEDPVTSLDEVRPRLDCARNWILGYADEADRTRVRDTPDEALLASLTDEERQALKLLAEHLADDWTYDGVQTLAYGVPKLVAGLPITAPPTKELKAAQFTWFKLLYRLLIGKERGPRMPTLLLAVGQAKVRNLIGR